MKIPTLSTSRLVLRPFTEEDVEPLHTILAQKDVLRYFPNRKPPERSGVGRFIVGQLSHWAEHGFGWWAVEFKGQKGLIGWNGLQYLPETEEIEVAYLLSRAYWGQGLALVPGKSELKLWLWAAKARAHCGDCASRAHRLAGRREEAGHRLS